MARLILLGTATAVPTPDRGPTSLAVEGEGGFVVVDCGENPLRHLAHVGLKVERLRGLFLTHFHPDHVAGVAPFLQSLWLLGRTAPLPIFGLREVLEGVWDLLTLFRWESWEGMFPVEPMVIRPEAGTKVTEIAGLRVFAAPVVHSRPTLALRFEAAGGEAAAYSADTAPCETMVELARGASLLVHEATGDFPGHTTPAQAGEIARQAGVKRLVLVHYPPFPDHYDRWLEEARATFEGPVSLGRDGDVYIW